MDVRSTSPCESPTSTDIDPSLSLSATKSSDVDVDVDSSDTQSISLSIEKDVSRDKIYTGRKHMRASANSAVVTRLQAQVAMLSEALEECRALDMQKMQVEMRMLKRQTEELRDRNSELRNRVQTLEEQLWAAKQQQQQQQQQPPSTSMAPINPIDVEHITKHINRGVESANKSKSKKSGVRNVSDHDNYDDDDDDNSDAERFVDANERLVEHSSPLGLSVREHRVHVHDLQLKADLKPATTVPESKQEDNLYDTYTDIVDEENQEFEFFREQVIVKRPAAVRQRTSTRVRPPRPGESEWSSESLPRDERKGRVASMHWSLGSEPSSSTSVAGRVGVVAEGELTALLAKLGVLDGEEARQVQRVFRDTLLQMREVDQRTIRELVEELRAASTRVSIDHKDLVDCGVQTEINTLSASPKPLLRSTTSYVSEGGTLNVTQALPVPSDSTSSVSPTLVGDEVESIKPASNKNLIASRTSWLSWFYIYCLLVILTALVAGVALNIQNHFNGFEAME